MDNLLTFGAVTSPLIAAFLCWLYLFFRLKRSQETLPLADAGLIFATFVFAYTAFPLFAAIIVGDEINFLTDNRLLVLNPSPIEIGVFMWNYVAFLAAFVAVYARVRRQDIKFSVDSKAAQNFMPGIVAGVVVLSLFFVVLDITAGVVTSAGYDTAFLDNFDRYASLPLFLQQITGHLSGILFVCKIALAALVAINFRSGTWRTFGSVWLAYELTLPFFQLGARSTSFFIILTFVMTYHKTIRPISTGVVLGAMLPLISAYMIQGVVRSGASVDDLGVLESMLTNNEFQSVFATAYDISIRSQSGSLAPPLVLPFADFLRLIPQQLLPFEKIDSAEWYLDVIGYKGTGVGFSFGAISEGIIGFGLPELLIRGALIGGVVGMLHNAVAKHSNHLGWIIFYLWFCTRIYLSFRNSLFYWLALAVYQLIPALILFSILKRGQVAVAYHRRNAN